MCFLFSVNVTDLVEELIISKEMMDVVSEIFKAATFRCCTSLAKSRKRYTGT